MRKIVVFNQKGGTGKTASTVNIAGCLEKNYGKRVLVIDCDSQMNSTNYLLTQEDIVPDKNIVDCVKRKTDIGNAILQVSLKIRKMKPTGIYLLPGSTDVDMVKVKDPLTFRDLLAEKEDEFDYCFFDCPANITDFTIAALSAANCVIIPAWADTDSLGGLSLLVDNINQIRDASINVDLKILGIFFNNVEKNNVLQKYIINDCRATMKGQIFETEIRHSSAVGQARYFGKPINYYKSKIPVTLDYLKLTEEIMNKMERMDK